MKMSNKIICFVKELNPVTKLILVLCLGVGCMIYPSPFLGYGILIVTSIFGGFIGMGKKLV